MKKKNLGGVNEKPGFRSPESDKLLIKKSKVRYWFPKVLLALLFLIVAACLIKVMIWENNYYREKEGSERAVAVSLQAPDQVEVDETEVTEEEKYEYTVPANYPRYLTIEKLGVYNARILQMGLTSDNSLDTPNNIFDVGWYVGSDKPGTGGTMLIDGHNGGPNIHGVFKELPSLSDGDIIKVERGDGVIFRYQVVENKTIPLSEANAYMNVAMISPYAGVESVTLISCTGDWSQMQQTYLSRQFTRAILVK